MLRPRLACQIRDCALGSTTMGSRGASGAMAVGMVCLLLGCQPPPTEKPAAPNMDALLASYATPSARLDLQSIAEILQRYEPQAAALTALCGWADVQAGCSAAGSCGECAGLSNLLATFGTLADDGVTEGAARAQLESLVEGEGYLKLTRICDGLGPVAVADATRSGSLNLTLGFTEQGFDPVVWGSLDHCATRRAGFDLVVNGEVQMSLGESWLLTELKQRPAVIALHGEVIAQGTSLGKLDLDFEVPLLFAPEHLTRRELRLRVRLAKGEVIFFVGENGRGFDASNGRFTCDLEQRRCQDDRGNDPIHW